MRTSKEALTQGQTDQLLMDFFSIEDPGCERLKVNLAIEWHSLVENHTYLAESLLLNRQKHIPYEQDIVTSITAYTGSPRKRKVIEELVEQTGLVLQFETPPQHVEEETRQTLKHVDYGHPVSYAMHIAQAKQTKPNKPVAQLSLDTIAFCRVPVHKPKNRQVAATQIHFLSGKRVEFRTGITLGAPTKSGGTIHVDNEASVSLVLNRLEEAAIEAYLENTPSVFTTAGSIDLTLADVRKLFVNRNEPIVVKSSNYLDEDKEVEIGPNEVDNLVSYFIGAPVHPIRNLLQQVQPLYQNL
jgi:predicted house-cleaning NTP pyrophosphatase (Maf/HAM1 superfamily)